MPWDSRHNECRNSRNDLTEHVDVPGILYGALFDGGLRIISLTFTLSLASLTLTSVLTISNF